MATQRITFCVFKPISNFDMNMMINNLLDANVPERYCVLDEQGEKFLKGCYLVEQRRNETKYNIEENKFETVNVSKLTVIKFEINLISEMMMTWGNKNCVQYLLTALSQASANKVIIDYKEVSFNSVLSQIIADSTISPTKVKIIDVLIENGIVASCNINLQNQDDGKRILQKYKESISQLSITFSSSICSHEEPVVSATIFSSGSIVVYKDRDSIPDAVIDTIQNLIE